MSPFLTDSLNGRVPNGVPKTASDKPAAEADNPPCVVGMACRVPGASSPSQLWENIMNKVDVQRKMPADRFNVDAFYHPDGTHKGTTNARYGYFLDQDLGRFDAGFFNISGKEAEAMDPQQRLLLEVVYEALEDAGITLDEIQGSQTSVFCGSFTNDYSAMTGKDLEYYPKYLVTGVGNSILSNRISYFYNLQGPSATIDTACSSSLVCFHLGAQSLRSGEAEISIVVGSALHYDSNVYITMTDLGMLSTDGRCRHGDAAGSGYVRGEGITAMILKRQSRAQADGDSIRAFVRGTGVNHDGRKQGITLPSSQAQAALIRSTYERAGLRPVDTSFVECHGTGTKAGDPRELKAIHEAFSQGREDVLHVGSVKTNIGHLEGASGIAGLIKATMALEKRVIPPNMHFSTPNPEIDFKGWGLQIPTAAKEWKVKNGIPRRVSINSFGYGGTNAHVILEEYDRALAIPRLLPPTIATESNLASMAQGRPYLVPLTSHSDRAGKLWGEKLAAYLAENQVSVADVAATLSSRRTMHRFRSFAIASGLDSVIERIQDPLPVAQWKSKLDSVPRLGFIFTGQGAQWFAMGRSLLEQSPLFLQTLERCDAILQALPQDRPTWSVVGELQKSQQDSNLSQTEYSQPICTAVQLGLLGVLAQWGIKPSGVVGHSSGELAATYAAGLLSFENALVAAYYRGVHMGSGAAAPGSVPGAMMAVGMTEAEVAAELEPYAGRIAVAAMNSPTSFTVSGDEDAVVELQQALSERKVFARRLQVAQAFHSHHMLHLAPGYKDALAAYPGFKGSKAQSAVMVSSVTGRIADPATMRPEYFTANMTGMVKFSDALSELVLDEEDQRRIDVLVEIGPHPALKGPSNQTLDQLKFKLPYLGTLDRKVDAFESLLTTAGQLFALGYPVNLEEVNRNQFLDERSEISSIQVGESNIALPSYAWDHHDRHWAETRLINEYRLRPFRHSMLGARVAGSLETRPRWRNFLRLSEISWLPDHSIDGKVIFPAAGYLNMAIEAAASLVDGAIREFELVDVSVKSALVISDKDMGTETIVEFVPVVESAETSSSIWKHFVVLSVDEAGNQREHCTGTIRLKAGSPDTLHSSSASSKPSVKELREQSFRSTERNRFYRRLHGMGLQYGETFQLMTGNVESGDGIATAPISWKPHLFTREESDISIIHPALLDACFHPVFASVEGKLGQTLRAPYVPTFIRSLRVSGLLDAWKTLETGYECEVLVETSALGPRTATNDVRLHSKEEGHLLLEIQGLKLTSLGDNEADDTKRTLFFGTQWKPMFTALGWSSPSSDEHYSLAKLVELYVHQHPNSKILHVTPGLSATEEDILPALRGITDAERRNIGHLTILLDGNAAPNAFDGLVQQGNGWVSVVNETAEDFDLVVVSTDVQPSAFPERVAENGYLIASGSSISDAPTTLQPFYSFSGVHIWCNTSSTYSQPGDALTIVMPTNPSAETRELANAIKSERKIPAVECDFLTLVEGAKDVHGDVVVLASLDANLYFEQNDEAEFRAAQALLGKEEHGNIVWLTRGGLMDASSPEQALVLGLCRSARSENPDLRLAVFDIAPSSSTTSQSAKLTSILLDRSINENEIAERGGLLYIPRLVASDDLNSKIPNGFGSEPSMQPLHQPSRPLALRIGQPGLLDTLVFSDGLELTSTSLQPDELEIEVKASALNARDIAVGMGTADDSKLGDECAGTVLRVGSNVSPNDFTVGDRVVAWRPGQGAHQTVVRNRACLCYRLQDQMPFAVAASIPLALTTAYYSIVNTARLQPGETILIHSAAGGVGQMAIQIAQTIEANIIVTVGSTEKRAFLMDTYGLEEAQILSSRDDSFVEGIHRLTNGRGVDVVLNSLAGPLLQSTWVSVAPFGRFVEIGKRDIDQNSRIPMDPFRRNVSFASVDMATMFEKNQRLGAHLLQECSTLVQEGKIQPPQPITEVAYADVHRAFRMAQTGTMSGKIVLIPGGPKDQVLVEPTQFRRRRLFEHDRVYLLVGGLGGLGRRLSEWLFERGARHLAFLSRSGAKRAEARETVEWLQERGVQVAVFSGDVSDASVVNGAIQQIEATPYRLAGVFHAAMVLQDAPLPQMTFAQWQTSLTPKVRGAYNLHQATISVPLDFFVCFSSLSGIVGSKAQANYSAGNSYLDALCAYRRGMGLVGTTMDVGMVVGIGAVSEDGQLQAVMEREGYDAVNEDEFFAQIETAVAPVSASADKLALVDSQGRDAHQTITGVNLRRATGYWVNEPRFRNLYANHDFAGSMGDGESKKQDVMAELQEAKGEEARVEILTDRFFDKIAAVLSVDKSILQPNRSLADYGLDSLVAMEIRQWFFKAVGVRLATFDILNSQSIRALVEKVVSVMVLNREAEPAAASEQLVNGAAADAEASVSLPAIDNVAFKSGSVRVAPMSSFQRRLWFMHNLAEDPSFLNVSNISRLRGQPNAELLRQTLHELKERNETLRTAYFEGDEFSQQEILENTPTELPEVDFSETSDPEAALNEHAQTLQDQPLDIESGEVMRTALIKLQDEQYALVLIYHHICIDRGSSRSIIEQVINIYQALRSDRPLASIARPAISYADFSIWHNALLQSSEMHPSQEFWKSVYETLPAGPMRLLPFAKATRPEANDYQRKIHRTVLKKSLLQRMKRICARLILTPAQFLMAALRAFLYRYTEEEDLTIHLVDGDRPIPAVNDTLGFFVNLVPIRCQVDHSGSFEAVLRQVKNRIMNALAHSQLPFDAIVDAVGVERSPAHFPLGQVVLNYQIHGTFPVYPAGDFDVTEVTGEDIPTASELQLEALEDPAVGLKLRLEYSSTLYGEEDMDCFLENFAEFLSSSIKDHRQPVSEVSMVGAKELEILKRNMFNLDVVPNTWEDQSVPKRILAIARQYADQVAVESSDVDDGSLTYSALVAKATGVLQAVQKSGVQPGSKVGILSKPGPMAIAAMLGVLLAGCGFVTLDPDFAKERLAFMVADSGVSVLVAQKKFEEHARALSSVPVLVLEKIPRSGAIIDAPVPVTKDSPFYTIYTSGSTGTPKGVVLSQSNTQQMLSTLHHDYGFTPSDRFLHQSSISFDLSIVQIFSALTAGARVCVASAEIRKDPVALAKYMEASQVSVTYFTPTQFALLMESASVHLQNLSNYRVAYFAGEKLPVRVARAFYELGTPAKAYNTWSPSELVVQTTIQEVEYPEGDNVNIPIGYPMANMRHYILDANAKPLPRGVVGELVVGGAQVGLGYINRPEVNERAFLADPFCGEEDHARGWGRMFRTGDKGRFLPGGNLEFHGRIAGDKQVKLRGFRVDLGEVEHRIFVEANKDPEAGGVVDLAVIAREVTRDVQESITDERQLIAFVVPRQSLPVGKQSAFAFRLNKLAGKHLNPYMLPSAYQFMDNLPATIGGKVDLQRLLKCPLALTYPVAEAPVHSQQGNGAMTDEAILEAVTQRFRQILKLPETRPVGPDDSFFALGGHSLLLMRLQARLKRALKMPLPLNAMFKQPTPRGIAQLMMTGTAPIASAPASLTQDSTATIDWAAETKLDDTLKPSKVNIFPSQITSVLLTGADSYIGVHMLATLMQDPTLDEIYVLGSHKQLEITDIYKGIDTYQLSALAPPREDLERRLIFLPGTLTSHRFGLSPTDFLRLARNIQGIYHLGGYISLLRSYDALREANVTSAHNIVRLASLGRFNTHIHHLSTWAVPHLQTWQTSTSTSTTTVSSSIIANEVSARHFTPESVDRLGYFKARWASEIVLENAAARGFNVSIYRASAATAHTATGVPEPQEDFIRTMILGMLHAKAIPQFAARERPFVVDFVPVDYITNSMKALSMVERRETQTGEERGPIYYHLSNPSPLPIENLPALMEDINGEISGRGRSLPFAEWIEAVQAIDTTPDAPVRWAVLREYFEAGHLMFGLENAKTRAALRELGMDNCQPVDVEYLREMVRREKGRVV
ncbi:hypothetical protein BDW59DRAFT_123333 [Aspergillus cavernicola]|uniref:Polyketide synthase n=1 Tax=Aspergillus cavernicola TaxID=176166 RepID=A0ABR4HV94_9EURO